MLRAQYKIVSENDGDCMTDFFGPDGLFCSKLEGFEYRAQQETLSKAIAEGLKAGGGYLLAAEAPTGVGKSFAFLAPAIEWVQKEGGAVLVLTSSIPLQEQLISKDLPALSQVMGVPVSFGLLKGRGNYGCMRKAFDLGDDGFLSFNDGGEASETIMAWLSTTDEGDLSEIPLPPGHPAVERISASFRGCLGSRCPFRERCFVQKSLRNAARWQVVVANYHLFFAYTLSRGGAFPVPIKAIFCDEAHRMAEALSSVSTQSVKKDDWLRHLKRVPPPRLDQAVCNALGYDPESQAGAVKESGELANAFFDRLDSLGVKGGIFTDPPEQLTRDGRALMDSLSPITSIGRKIDDYISDMGPAGEDVARDNGEYLAWSQVLGEMIESLRWCLDVSDYPHWTYWREEGGLFSSPSWCGDMLPCSFGVSGDSPVIVALSATMAVDGKLDYWIRETGLVPDRTLLLDSPFDLKGQMDISVVDLDTAVTDERYDDRVCRVVRKLCKDNRGSSLVLLSSTRLLRRVGSYLKRNDDGYSVLVQGELPRSELLRLFREDRTSVLVGTVSFREGVDVPGDSLTQVIVDRVPFPHPEDPVQIARRDLEGQASFMRSVLPSAKMNLRQAIGRLIRSGSDRGKVAILDGRVLSRGNWRILESLPSVPIKRVRVIDRAVAHIGGV